MTTIIPNPLADLPVTRKQRKVVKEGSKWCVKSKAGKSLGCYDTKEEANQRLRQIEFHKNK